MEDNIYKWKISRTPKPIDGIDIISVSTDRQDLP